MSIAFTPQRFEQVLSTYEAWWNHELDRPVMGVVIPSRDPGRIEPSVPLLSQETCNLYISA